MQAGKDNIRVPVENEHKNTNRMGKTNMEPDYGLHKGICWL
ncbi:hypothetical protein [uncultured Gammaproteobacteria bacterium]|jgi:hypothetical protein|nr:hypothetical protein [uncultured Gammaproteobacteria bacterium]CAC9950931.1 hypothetical protein [uncultured Gammaproteobacteria bacterium]